MNYLELQQRANLLVDKVNTYEESLVGQEIDETQILNEHKYVDIYSLRPVLKLLFGATLAEKLNRTLDNDVALRVFASTAPAWKSSFNLLSYQLGVQPLTINYTSSSAFTTDFEGLPVTPNTTDALEYNFHIKLSRIRELTSGSSWSTGIKLFVNTNQELNYFGTDQEFLLYTGNKYINRIYIPRSTLNTYDYLDFYFKVELTKEAKLYCTTTIISPDGITRISKRDVAGNTGTTIRFTFANTNSFSIVDNNASATYYQHSQDVGFETDTHEFIQNIDTYNNHNMLQLDVKQNEVITRDDRIKKGINYSYSSNIADALVTESQVANLFAWNTTTKETIANNLITFNRQVPGIVTYYLGNDYTSEYTATIPYNPRQDTINAVNYNTPPYYGAFYRDTDYTQSQVGLNPGAECCRIFMPGCNYTRGLLESPQQIWQPDKKVGNDNIDLGYNWQGRALYHELVFKNRRAGCGNKGLDFIPTLDTIADNDPQGLATRFVLAQQKPYYYKRPWFNELDNLYGTNATKFADYINKNSISVPTNSTPVFDKSKFELSEGVELSEAGILTVTDDTVRGPNARIPELDLGGLLPGDRLEIYSSIITGNIYNPISSLRNQAQVDACLDFDYSNYYLGKFQFYTGSREDAPRKFLNIGIQSNAITPGYTNTSKMQSKFTLEFRENNTLHYNYYIKIDDGEWIDYTSSDYQDVPAVPGTLNLYFKDITFSVRGSGTRSQDLSTFKIIKNDSVLFEASTVPGTSPMNDEEFYKSYKLDYETYAKALDQPL